MEEIKITRTDIEQTHDQLVGDWCNQFCDIVHEQLILTYGDRHGFEEHQQDNETNL